MDKRKLIDDIAENAAGPQSAMGDGQSLRQHSLRDQIDADKYLAARRALRKRPLGFRTVQLRPGNNADLDVRGGL